LMALGCAFIFLVILMLWRRRARKQRAKRTAMFASAKSLDGRGWRGKLVRFREWLFGHHGKREEVDLMKMRDLEEERHHREMEKILGAYEYSRAGSTRRTERDPSAYDNDRRNSALSAQSLYSQITGSTRRVPEPRLPVKKQQRDATRSRFSMSTLGSEGHVTRRVTPPIPTEAELYAEARRESLEMASSETGGSKNPFRR